VIVYTLGSAVIPVWAWLLTAISRQPRATKHMRHARPWSTPRPLRQRHRGSHVFHGRHVFQPTLTEAAA
jgi:hypothetical protein